MTPNPNDPYKKICRYRFCREPFDGNRLNTEFCRPEHKRKENNWKQRLKRQLIKEQLRLQVVNEQILQSLYAANKFLVTIKLLQDAGFNFNASSQVVNDKATGRVTLRYFDYGYQAIDSTNFKIVFFGNSIIKPIK